MTTTYTFTTVNSFSINFEYLSDIIYDDVMNYIADGNESEIPQEIKLQVLKDAAKYILAHY